MPQRFLCAVNCIRDIFLNEPAILRPSADCLGDSNFKQVNFADMNLENRTFRVTGTLTHVGERACGGATMAKAGAIHAAHEPARRSRRAMIFTGDYDTSSRPPDDWGGVSVLRDSKTASTEWGYDVISQITACNTPGS